jgi:orotate phosphoribosyltransferase
MKHPELARILIERSYLERHAPEEPFILASGKASWHYFDCERTTSYARALPLLGAAFYEPLHPRAVCVGGPTRGADPIADAIAYYSYAVKDREVNTFSVRAKRKEHGLTGHLEGSARAGDFVAFVDDVVTSGKSVIDAVEKCRDEDLIVTQILVLVDREEGGMERIREWIGSGVPVESIFRYSELLDYRRSLDNRELAAGERR